MEVNDIIRYCAFCRSTRSVNPPAAPHTDSKQALISKSSYQMSPCHQSCLFVHGTFARETANNSLKHPLDQMCFPRGVGNIWKRRAKDNWEFCHRQEVSIYFDHLSDLCMEQNMVHNCQGF